MGDSITLVPNPGLRVCRVCKNEYVGFGALCPTHAAELATQNAQANMAASAVLEARINAQQAERRARRRAEWRECV
jgi:hypothetical protein